MNKTKMWKVFATLMVLSLVLAACGGAVDGVAGCGRGDPAQPARRPDVTPTYGPVGLGACRVVVQATAHGVRCVLPDAHDLDAVAYALAQVGVAA